MIKNYKKCIDNVIKDIMFIKTEMYDTSMNVYGKLEQARKSALPYTKNRELYYAKVCYEYQKIYDEYLHNKSIEYLKMLRNK